MTRMGLFKVSHGVLWTVLLAGPPCAGQLPDIPLGDRSIRVQISATGLAGTVGGEFQISPTDIVRDGTGRLFVATLGGIVRVVEPDGTLQPAPYLTAGQTENVPAESGEWGMTGMAVHPDFANMGAPGYGKLYTITTRPTGGSVDFSVAGDHVDVVTEWIADDVSQGIFTGYSREIMRVGQPQFPHNIVDLAFDTDRYLYIASGDGGFATAAQAQDLTKIHGKILRVDPLDPALTDAARGAVSGNGKYRVPQDNAFALQPGALDEIWAYGLRNSFRMNFDRATGDLWVGDVGQNQIEEANLVNAGQNSGWNVREGNFGTQPAGGSVDPVFQYDHTDGRSIIGGFVYRGSLRPDLVAQYVFADLGQNLPTARIFYGDPATGEFAEFLVDPRGDTFVDRLDSLPDTDLLPLPERVISIGEDLNGELYLGAVGFDPRPGGGLDGMIVRILPPYACCDLNTDKTVDAADAGILFGQAIRRPPNLSLSLPRRSYAGWRSCCACRNEGQSTADV